MDIAKEIDRLKRELGDSVCVMGHHYQNDAVAAHCDIMGDSLELARKMSQVTAEHVIFCGVYFMGETAALLAGPNQKVYLPEPDANCMMSLMASARMARAVLEQLNSHGRKIIPLAYVNTMLELKDVVGEYGGAVCTSANAGKMLAWALGQADGVLFLPDRHLGRNTAKNLGIAEEDQYIIRINGRGLLPGQEEQLQKRLLFWPGSCAVHARLTPADIEKTKQEHPGCKVFAHPECKPELINLCDGAGSTSYLIKQAEKFAREQPDSTLIIGTEENLVGRLARKFASQIKIRPLGRAFCPHMDKVTPEKLLATLKAVASGQGDAIMIDKSISDNARLSITRMLDICA